MRKRSQLNLMVVPPMALSVFALVGLAFDAADWHNYIGLLLCQILVMLGAVVSYLHRLLYGEDEAPGGGHER